MNHPLFEILGNILNSHFLIFFIYCWTGSLLSDSTVGIPCFLSCNKTMFSFLISLEIFQIKKFAKPFLDILFFACWFKSLPYKIFVNSFDRLVENSQQLYLYINMLCNRILSFNLKYLGFLLWYPIAKPKCPFGFKLLTLQFHLEHQNGHHNHNQILVH